MELTVVGSGTAVPDPGRVCASLYLEAGGCRILLDCGPGACHHLARFGLPWQRLSHVVLSHFHTDHVGDLPYLLFALKYGVLPPRTEPLALWGPAGTRERAGRLAAAFGRYLLEPGFPLDVEDLRPGESVGFGRGVHLRTYATPHTEASLACRIEADGASLGYTGDTGFDEGLAAFLAGVDLLVAECSLPDEQAMDTHLTPSRVAALASRASPGILLLTHVYPQLDRRRIPALVRAAGWDGAIEVVGDGARFTA